MFTRRVVPMVFAMAILAMSLGMSGNGCQSVDNNKTDNPGRVVPPALAEVTATGTLTQKQAATLTLSCIASATDAQVLAVTADLSCLDRQLVFLQAGLDGSSWTWSGTVTPSCSGPRTIPLTIVDSLGQLVTMAATIEVAPAPNLNRPPLITNVQVSGGLVNGLPCRISISCAAADPDQTVTSVIADLTSLGAGKVILRVSGSSWIWVGTVTPIAAGNQTITLTATDKEGVASTAAATVQVRSAPPQVSNVQVTGSLIAGHSGQITVSCETTDTDGTVETVTADLAALGGGTVFLEANGMSWSWTGLVTPAAAGNQTITLTATDDAYVSSLVTATARVMVAPALVTNVQVKGTFTIGQTGPMTVSCDATNPNGTIRSVTANLGAFGAGAVSLVASGSSWSWSGAVTPSATGPARITLTVINGAGGTLTASTIVNVHASPAPLAGAWISTDDPLGMGLTTSLIIAADGTPVAESLSMASPFGPPLVYQVIPDGQEHIAFDMLGPTMVHQTPYRFLMDDPDRVTVDPTTLTLSTQGSLLVGGTGVLLDANTMVLTAEVGDMQGATFTFTRLVPIPSLSPYIKAAAVTGDLDPHSPATVDLSCELFDPSGTLTSVVADLARIGGPIVPLTKAADGTWKAQGVPVNPQIAAKILVPFTASNAAGPQAGLNAYAVVD